MNKVKKGKEAQKWGREKLIETSVGKS